MTRLKNSARKNLRASPATPPLKFLPSRSHHCCRERELFEMLSPWKWLKSRPESGLGWLICSKFVRQLGSDWRIIQTVFLDNR